MPSTKTISCDEGLLADRFLRPPSHDLYNEALFLSKLTNVVRSSVKHHYAHAAYSYGPINKYEGAFVRVLSRARCRQRKLRTSTVAIPEKNIALMSLLGAWLKEDAQEQNETWKRLEPVLEENRSSNRKLFS